MKRVAASTALALLVGIVVYAGARRRLKRATH